MAESDDEYEYEYSNTETETFFVDLDLSSVNGVIKSKNAGERKVLKAPTTETELDAEEETNDGIQILELHSRNPIVSYRDQLYSCDWVDMIGTNMFVTAHQESPFHEPEISTDEYDLLGTSRIKLVGSRGTVNPKPGSRKRLHEDDAAPATLTSQPLPMFERNDPRTNADNRRQATFLEQLMEVKKARGEKDRVRIVVDKGSATTHLRRKEEAKTHNEIEALNKRVVRGDTDALQRLQEIYSRMEEVSDDEDDIIAIRTSVGSTSQA